MSVEELRVPDDCAPWRLDLCRLAVTAPTERPVSELAAHARGCPDCAAWVDELARARTWIEGRAAAAPPPDVAVLAQKARAALVRELAARLARDLQDEALGREGRSREVRRRDLVRVLALVGRTALRAPPWRQVPRLLLAPPRPPASARRTVALRLAARLDPLGLDVALGHLAALEREGRAFAANAEADRLLALVG